MIIAIEKYPVFVKLGVFDSEQLYGQEILVDLKLQLQHGTNINDQKPPTVDYGEVLRQVDQILKSTPFKLIESMLQALGHHFKDQFPQLSQAEFSVHKPILPNGIDKGAKVSISETFCYNR